MKKAAKPLIFVLVLVIFFGAIGLRISRNLHKPPPPPRTAIAHRGDFTLYVMETGTLEPSQKVDVKSKVAGRLLTIPIQEGQYVHEGQLIATVDRTLIDPQIAQQQAQLAQAQARLQQTESAYQLQLVQTRMAIDEAQAGLKSAQAHLAAVAAPARPQEVSQQQQQVARARIALEDAQRTQKRKAALVAKGYVAQADVDSAQTAVDTAQSTLDAAEQALSLTLAGPRVQDIRDAQAQVASARVQLESARANAVQNAVSKSNIAQARANVQEINQTLAQLQVNLGDTRIIAPASGIVLKKYKEPTEIVQSATTGFSDAQSIVATLGNALLVRVGINEVDIPRVKLGAPVTITVDALPGETFAGKVTEIAPASSNSFDSTGATSSGTQSISKFSVKVALDKSDPRLRPGMTAAVQILSAQKKNVVLAPLEAVPITGDAGQVTVMVGNQQQKRSVTLGLRNDSEVEIASGLKPGEKLVIPKINASDRRKINITGPD